MCTRRDVHLHCLSVTPKRRSTNYTAFWMSSCSCWCSSSGCSCWALPLRSFWSSFLLSYCSSYSSSGTRSRLPLRLSFSCSSCTHSTSGTAVWSMEFRYLFWLRDPFVSTASILWLPCGRLCCWEVVNSGNWCQFQSPCFCKVGYLTSSGQSLLDWNCLWLKLLQHRLGSMWWRRWTYWRRYFLGTPMPRSGSLILCLPLSPFKTFTEAQTWVTASTL